MISKYTSTSYPEVMELDFKEIDRLFDTLMAIFKEEAKAREEAMEEAGHGKRKNV